MTLGTWLVVFGLSAGVLVVVGTHLSKAGDQIATVTGVGGMLIGGILLAGATSLPSSRPTSPRRSRVRLRSPWATCSAAAWRTWRSSP